MGRPSNKKLAQDRNEAIQWAKSLLQRNDWVIWDTETTGLKQSGKDLMQFDEIIQIGIVDHKGNTVFESFLNPVKRRMSEEAKIIHGIEISMLKNAPRFHEIMPTLEEKMSGKDVVVYNAEYECQMLIQTLAKFKELGKIDLQKYKDFKFNMLCAMVEYSKFMGEWNDNHQDYKFQKLPGASHNVIGDCLATLELIKNMANSELTEIQTSWLKRLFD
jgi:DNA polymerase III subunit epsilon